MAQMCSSGTADLDAVASPAATLDSGTAPDETADGDAGLLQHLSEQQSQMLHRSNQLVGMVQHMGQTYAASQADLEAAALKGKSALVVGPLQLADQLRRTLCGTEVITAWQPQADLLPVFPFPQHAKMHDNLICSTPYTDLPTAQHVCKITSCAQSMVPMCACRLCVCTWTLMLQCWNQICAKEAQWMMGDCIISCKMHSSKEICCACCWMNSKSRLKTSSCSSWLQILRLL